MADVLQFPSPVEQGPVRHEVLLPDEAARKHALDTGASWIVEAPAGSGKTGLLMQRYLKLLADKGTRQPEEVLAITFTRKATAELRTRVLEQLEAAHTGTSLRDPDSAFECTTRVLAQAVLERDAQLGWSLLENPAKLRVRTIDSLCAEIAGALPLLSGGGGERRPVEDAMPLYRQAARRTLMHLGGQDATLHQAIATVLLHRDGNLLDCESLLARMLLAREQWAELVPLDRRSLNERILEDEVRPRLERSLESIVCAGLTRAMQTIPRHVLYELTELASRLGVEPGHAGKESPIAFCAGRNLPPEAQGEHLDHWVALVSLLMKPSDCDWRKRFEPRDLGFQIEKADRALLKRLVDEVQSPELQEAFASVLALPPARYPDDQWHVAKALFRLLLHALAELKVLFAERGECDFAELALAARDALQAEEGPADLATASGSALRHLLVDEMQDTSSAQYELLHLLTRSWDGHSQTLFLVGDPKQSIYLFRQARVERFLRTMREERLGDVPIGALRLTANFRSQPGLVKGFNRDFERIFPSPQQAASTPEEGDVPFVAAEAVRGPGTTEGIVLHASVLGGEDAEERMQAKRDHVQQEAREVRRIVEAWRSRPLPADRKTPWRIAVLVRARNHLAPIVTEFQHSGPGAEPVPFRAVNVEALNERTEVLDAFALTRALLHPADRVAWLAVLHAPWCGLGLADLLALTGEGAVVSAETARMVTVPSLVASRSKHLSAEGQALLNRAWPVLQATLTHAGRGDFAALIERTWRSLGADVLLGPTELTNVQRYFALLRDLQRESPRIDLRALKMQLGKLYAAPDTAEGAVDLMTIHSAKGLEWDVVIVPGLERRSQFSRGELLDWIELDATDAGAPSVVLAPIQRKGEQATDLARWLRRVRDGREKAERKRLLYVACTRAREELHLFASCEHSSKGELRPPAGTLLESYWPAAQEQFERAAPIRTQVFTNRAAAARIAEPAETESETLALAATAAPEEEHQPPLLHRLPLGYDPAQRFREAAEHRLPYIAASALRPGPEFERPEGSFAVRAFGNVVHRYLQALAERMATGTSADDLLDELPAWEARLLASLRGEGLPPALCAREAARALQALTNTLRDPVGRWVLSPHFNAGSESALTLADTSLATLRVDRTFLAGTAPLSSGENALWIIDYKTSEQGSRSPEHFAAEEREKYGPQLTRYAQLLRTAQDKPVPIMLGLYYPLVPRLIHWQA